MRWAGGWKARDKFLTGWRGGIGIDAEIYQ
jgi:hypothetical protein